jgi:hypothetical protein
VSVWVSVSVYLTPKIVVWVSVLEALGFGFSDTDTDTKTVFLRFEIKKCK